MWGAIYLSMPIIIASAAVFAVFCAALIIYEKREERRIAKRKTSICAVRNGTGGRRLA